MEKILAIVNGALAKAHLSALEHFPENEESRECWQYDGGLDGTLIVVTPYTNVHGHACAHVDATLATGETWGLWSALLPTVGDQVEQKCLLDLYKTLSDLLELARLKRENAYMRETGKLPPVR